MAVRVVVAAVISAVLMFAWGFVFWGPVLSMTAKLVSPLPAGAELDVVAPLRAARVLDGMYAYPGPLADMSDEAAAEAWEKKLHEGPLFQMAYRSEGVSPMDPTMFAKSLAHSFVIALLSGLLLTMVLHALPSYASRVGFLAMVSVIAAFWTNGSNVIWWFHSSEYAAGSMAYEFVAGLLMALATAAIVRLPAPATPQAASKPG
jgi:hypothetical protein